MVRRTSLGVMATALVIGACAMVNAQETTTRVSPHERVTGLVDGATLTIEYGRPYVKGREIFGRLVPYDRVWCPGADEATTLNSTHELVIGDLRIPAGPHTIWMLPTEDHWTLIVSKEASGFHNR